MFVVYTEDLDRVPDNPALGARESLVLRSLNDPSRFVRFDAFATEAAARLGGAHPYRLVCEVQGRWIEAPTHAVYAKWQVDKPRGAAAFEESRRRLFVLRSHVLPTFVGDWLLKHLDNEGQYMVLGLYGDMDGATRLCRDHPEIKQFAQQHPATEFSARDITGLQCFRIEQRGLM